MDLDQLRAQMACCSTCGVSWRDLQISLDCFECGGYAMERPCPTCDGTCGATWKRDLMLSHRNSKAIWEGECNSPAKRAGAEGDKELTQRSEKVD